MTLVPSFHCPRFFSNSTRSKRFKTLRLAVMVLAPFKLRCCDIDCSRCLCENARVGYGASPIFQMEYVASIYEGSNRAAACRRVHPYNAFWGRLLDDEVRAPLPRD